MPAVLLQLSVSPLPFELYTVSPPLLCKSRSRGSWMSPHPSHKQWQTSAFSRFSVAPPSCALLRSPSFEAHEQNASKLWSGVQTCCLFSPIKMPPCLPRSVCVPTPFNASLALRSAAWVIFIARPLSLSVSPFLFLFPPETNKSNAMGQKHHRRHHLRRGRRPSPTFLSAPCSLCPSLLQHWQIDKRTVLSFFAFHLSNLPPSILPDGYNAGALSCGRENAALN